MPRKERGALSSFAAPARNSDSVPEKIPARMVMKCRGNLNQPLQTSFLVAGCRKPDVLPHFVRVKEAPRIEKLDAARESFDLVR